MAMTVSGNGESLVLSLSYARSDFIKERGKITSTHPNNTGLSSGWKKIFMG
jgi:hypothetical protein